eukprot:2852208-Rhodomonas_salina.2
MCGTDWHRAIVLAISSYASDMRCAVLTAAVLLGEAVGDPDHMTFEPGTAPNQTQKPPFFHFMACAAFAVLGTDLAHATTRRWDSTARQPGEACYQPTRALCDVRY